MNLSGPFIKRSVMTTLIFLTLTLSGLLAFFALPINDVPSIEKPVISITTSYPGASSATVLNQVTHPLEKELLQVKGLHEIDSYSFAGASDISLSFELSANMDEALRAVQSAINHVEPSLPKEIDRPSYQMQETGNESILYILLSSKEVEKKELEAYAESFIIPNLSHIEGVAKVKPFGSTASLWLRLNPELMAARQIGFNQVIDTLKAHLSEKPLGSIRSGNKTLMLELSGIEDNEKTLESLLIGDTSIRIKDIGEISTRSHEDKQVYYVTRTETTPTLLFGIQKIRGGNTVGIANNVEKTLSELKKNLPPSFHLELWFNKAVWIEGAIHEVEWSLLLSSFLVVLVIYLSLGRLTEALIPSIALPLSLLGTFSIMFLASFSLDLLSLLALTLSVGFVVDDAIVVVENIVRHQEKGESPLEASLVGSREIGFTILSMTLSLVAVFIPLLFMGGMNGRLLREFSITLSIAILVSGFVSLTLTPFLCSRFAKSIQKPSKLASSIQNLTASCQKGYGRILKVCLNRPLPILLGALGLSIAASFLFLKLPINLVPDEDRGVLIASVNLPQSVNPKETDVFQNKLNSIVLENANVDNFLSVNLDGRILQLIRLKQEHSPQPGIINDLQNALNEIPGTYASVSGYQMIHLDFDLGSGGRYKYVIQGTDFKTLDQGAEKLVQALRIHPDFTSAKAGRSNENPMLEIAINEGLASRYGLTKQQIQETFGHAYGKSPIGHIVKDKHKTPLFMELKSGEHAISKLFLTNKSGTPLPLRMFASWKEKAGSFSLHHLDHLPAETVRFTLKDGIPPSVGMATMENIAKEILPGELTGKFAGAAEAIASSQKSWIYLLLVACLAMYLVLGILYESFIHPLTILSSIPFAGLGGIITLFIFNEPLSLFSAVGFLLLIGIVKKNGIMIVDYALEMQKKGMAPKEAIYEGCLVRFRPIMMTTFAAVMGALPLAIGLGESAKLHRGLGLVIVGGLIFSQALTLFITPIFYIYFEKLRTFRKALPNPVEL